MPVLGLHRNYKNTAEKRFINLFPSLHEETIKK